MEEHILLTLSWGFYNNFAGSFIAAPPECTCVKKKKKRERVLLQALQMFLDMHFAVWPQGDANRHMISISDSYTGVMV